MKFEELSLAPELVRAEIDRRLRENLAFPLRNRRGDARLEAAEISKRVQQALEMLGLESLANRKARGLSADDKQKISLGRGLVRTDVNAILFDEPLTVIDPHMKWVLRSQLKQLHRRFGYTMVYVTHDQTEALTFADTVVVMYEGQIVQIGTPSELFEKPRHTFVGYFIGSPGMNVMPVTLSGRTATFGARTIELPGGATIGAGARVELGIRPEYVQLGRAGVPVVIRKVEDIGRHRIVRADLESQELAIIVPEHAEIPAEPHVTFDPRGINLYADSWRVEMQG